MDHNACAFDLHFQCIFDSVTYDVRVAHAHFGSHNQMKLDEGDAACNAGLEIMNLNCATGIGRNHIANPHFLCRLDTDIHQALYGFIDNPPALPENVDRNQNGKQRIEDRPTRNDGSNKPHQNTYRRKHISHNVLTICFQRRRTRTATSANEQQRP